MEKTQLSHVVITLYLQERRNPIREKFYSLPSPVEEFFKIYLAFWRLRELNADFFSNVFSVRKI